MKLVAIEIENSTGTIAKRTGKSVLKDKSVKDTNTDSAIIKLRTGLKEHQKMQTVSHSTGFV